MPSKRDLKNVSWIFQREFHSATVAVTALEHLESETSLPGKNRHQTEASDQTESSDQTEASDQTDAGGFF